MYRVGVTLILLACWLVSIPPGKMTHGRPGELWNAYVIVTPDLFGPTEAVRGHELKAFFASIPTVHPATQIARQQNQQRLERFGKTKRIYEINRVFLI